MSLEDTPSDLKKDLTKGITAKTGETRVVKEGVRKTDAGKSKAGQAEKDRMKSDQIIKANMKQKEDQESEESWESAEEDAPAIRLEELLGNMKIEGSEDEESGNDQSSGSDGEEEEKKN